MAQMAGVSRHESHLMRQRGAGARGVTASFGFSFALPATTTLDAIQRPEPPAKRQKLAENVPQVEDREYRTRSVKKIKRKLPVELHDQLHAVLGDDSFVAKAKRKVRRPAKPQAVKNEVLATCAREETAEKGAHAQERPRPQATALPTMRVAEELEAEYDPVATKRREISPVARTTRKVRGKAQKAAAHPKEFRNAVDATPVQPEETLDEGQAAHETSVDPSVRVVNVPVRRGKRSVARAKAVKAKPTIHIAAQRDEEPLVPPPIDLPTTVDIISEPRIVLAEADANIVRPSPSPEKSKGKRRDAAKGPEWAQPNVEHLRNTVGRVKKRSRVDVAPDGATDVVAGGEAELSGEPLSKAAEATVESYAAEETRPPKKARKTAKKTSATSKAMAAPERPEESIVGTNDMAASNHLKTRPDVPQVAAMTAAAAAEEDVDWLFALPAPKRVSHETASKSTKRRSFRKLADIDLDDLVTNIASFAPTKVTAAAIAKIEDGMTAKQSAGVKRPRQKARR